MKIAIAYPPLEDSRGVPLLSQNRQFQYFKEPTYIYPVVPAQAATMLSRAGFDVLWLDAIAQNLSYKDFLHVLSEEKPDLVAIETKTPVVGRHWKIVDDIKSRFGVTVVMFGDHVTALPQESLDESKVDYVLTGGDYDFLLLNLSRYLNGEIKIDKLEGGIWYRGKDGVKNTGAFTLNHDLNEVPFIDRNLTKWKQYAYKNGNFKDTPGTYIMSGRDCWWGKCTFCSWPTLYPEFRARKVDNVLDEIALLSSKFRIREIMDDTGTFPIGSWLEKFCSGMIDRGLNKRLSLDCNMRFGSLTAAQYRLMKKAGFRLVLFGLESGNQNTLDRLSKNLTVEQIKDSCRMAKEAGLYPHITIMFGYPWETYQEALNTLELGRWLLKKNYAYTVQATLVIPYPGSPLFNESKKLGLLQSVKWSDYDMRSPVLKIPFETEKLLELIQGIYKVAFEPEFIWKRLYSIRSFSDLVYFKRGIKKVLGHIFDFKHKKYK